MRGLLFGFREASHESGHRTRDVYHPGIDDVLGAGDGEGGVHQARVCVHAVFGRNPVGEEQSSARPWLDLKTKGREVGLTTVLVAEEVVEVDNKGVLALGTVMMDAKVLAGLVS